MLKVRINKKICAALAFALLVFGGCGDRKAGGDQTSPTHASLPAADGDGPLREEEKQPLRIAFGRPECTYHFFPRSNYDKLIDSLTGVKLAARDRNGEAVMNGIGGESRSYNGRSYFYTGISDISRRYYEEADETMYSIKLREDVRFSDGEILCADDVVFTLYLLLDPSVIHSPLRGAGIKGTRGYRSGYAAADGMTDDEIAAALQTDEVKRQIHEAVIEPLIRDCCEWAEMIYDCGDTYDNSAYKTYMEKCPGPKELLALLYSVDGEYDPAEADAGQVVEAIADMYGGDFELLGIMNSGDPDELRDPAETAAISYLMRENGETDRCDHISGIVKTGEFSLDITVNGNSSALPRLLTEVTVFPLHYYGEKSGYDYEEHKFGLETGSAADILSEKADAPLGAGAYRLEKSENGTAYFSANGFYYKGAPLTENIEVILTDRESMITAVTGGSADISFPEASAAVSGEIDDPDAAPEKLAAYTIALDGYSFIGINVKNVNIGGEPLSEKSAALRKALAAAISLYREDSVRDYYGSFAIPVSFPAPVYAYLDSGAYEGCEPYRMKIDGTPIYADDTDGGARREAVKAACLEYLEAAGYTVGDGRVTGAPGGGPLSFRASAAAGGTGAHPSYNALKNAAELLSEIGITLYINDTADISRFWEEISGGRQEIWAYVWETGAYADIREMYSTGNLFGIESEQLSEYAEIIRQSSDKEELSAAYEGCYRLLYDEYAAEIPVYRRSGCFLASALRIDAESLPEDMTCYYGWTDEIEKIYKKG